MSVGHVARLLEEAGIPTVIIAVKAFRFQLERMTPSRSVITPHLLGRPLGAPHDRDRQRAVILAALDLLERASSGGTIFDFPDN